MTNRRDVKGWTKPIRYRKTQAALLTIVAVVAALWLLQSAFILTMPLAFAFVLAVLVRPVHRVLDRRLPRYLKWLSLVAALMTMLAVVSGAVGLICLAAAQVQEHVPKYSKAFAEIWRQISAWLVAHGLNMDGAETSGKIQSQITSLLAGLVPSVFQAVGLCALTVFFALIMLVEVHDWEQKSRQALTADNQVVRAIRLSARKIRRYMISRTAIALSEAVIEGTFLWVVGVDFWYLWGLLFFLLNFVPNVGPFLALFPPVVVTLIQMGPWWMLLVLAVLVTIDQLIGNYIAPVIQGREQGLSALVMLASVMFWGWLWGIPGAVLAIPLTVTLVMFCSLFESLRPLAVLLSWSPEDLPKPACPASQAHVKHETEIEL